MVRVKACGIRSLGDALVCVRAGVDAIGLIVGVTHRSEDKLSANRARQIAAALPPFVNAVLVTHLVDPGAVANLVRTVKVDTVQLHGDLNLQQVEIVRKALPAHTLIKCVHVTGPEAVRTAVTFEPLVDAILLDSRTPDRLGGTGKTHDWGISRQVVEALKKPVILAGGLTPANVAAAITAVRPYAVDANSGLDDERGHKDIDKVRLFVHVAKREYPFPDELAAVLQGP